MNKIANLILPVDCPQRAIINGKFLAHEVETRIKVGIVQIDTLNREWKLDDRFNNHIGWKSIIRGKLYEIEIEDMDFTIKVKCLNVILFPDETVRISFEIIP